MPSSIAVLSPAKDDESDENISLDLHVSDAEDTEEIIKDKNDEEIPMEIEDDILNKFEIKETLRPLDEPSDDDEEERPKENGEEDKENGEEEEVQVEVKKASEEEELKDTVEATETEVTTEDKVQDEEKVMEEENEEVMEEEKVDKAMEAVTEEEKDNEAMEEEKKGEKKEEKSNDKKVEPKEEEKMCEDEVQKGEKKTTEHEANTDEESNKEGECEQEDLLQIMEEKTTEADETEFENDGEDESTKSNEKNGTSEHSENNSDDNPSDSEGGHLPENQEKDPLNVVSEENDENVDSTMDMEEDSENNDDASHHEDETSKEQEVSLDGLNVTVLENKVSESAIETEPSEDAAKAEENKENVENNMLKGAAEGKSVLESILKSAKPLDSKSTKRQLSDDSSSGEDSSKKIKLVEEEKEAQKPQDTSVVYLNGFKKFMLDKSLKGITRDQLEVFCIQKMCECIVQKSEIGELKLKVKMQEQLLDCLRKEVVNVSKQARDLNIVHQKVIQDVSRLQETSDKPLIVPKITRSVGLQAVVRGDDKRKTPRASPIVNKTPARAKNTPAANITPVPQRATPTNDRVAQKTSSIQSTPTRNVTAAKPKAIAPMPSTPPTNAATVTKAEVNGKGAGVIDLTDEDDKKTAVPTTPVTPNGTKVNMINAPNGHKFVLMPNGQTVMVKIATPSSTGVVVSQPVIRTVQASPTNGTVRTVSSNSVLRTMQQPVRAVLTTQVRGRAPVPAIRPQRPIFRAQVQKVVRHPAPLPNASPVFIEGAKPIPPKPHLMLNKTSCGTGIVLSWKMPYKLDIYEKIASYQLYAYQETKSEPKTESWGKIGDVKALELPMAVTLTHFAVGNRYYFAVRAVDNQSRPGEFSEYQTILL